MFRKSLTVLLSLIILLCSFSFLSAYASDNAITIEFDREKYYSTSDSNVNAKIKAAKEIVYNAAANVDEYCDIMSLGIPNQQDVATAFIKEIKNLIADTPDIFYVASITVYSTNTTLSRIVFNYDFDIDTCRMMRSEAVAAADKLLADIEFNNALTDVQKALLVHDRIIAHTEYDYDAYLNNSVPGYCFNFYGTLVKHRAVCTGYASTFKYIMDRLGIECEYCSSDLLCHTWNLITIDGQKYNVDLTWDDPVYDLPGRVSHDYFMISNNAMLERDHLYNEGNGSYSADFPMPATSTKYDNYVWSGSECEFLLVNDTLYYLDNVKEAVYSLNINFNQTLIATCSAKWQAGTNTYWVGNHSRFATDGKNLYYSTDKKIYKLNLATKATETIVENKEGLSSYYSIVTFTIEDKNLIYVVNPKVYLESSSKANFRYIILPSMSQIIKICGQTFEADEGTTFTPKNILKFYAEDGYGYRFREWRGNTELLQDKTVLNIQFTVPDHEIELYPDYYIIGDINYDGSINAIDSNIMKKMMSGLADEDAPADINDDGNINSIDSSMLLRMNLGYYIPER